MIGNYKWGTRPYISRHETQLLLINQTYNKKYRSLINLKISIYIIFSHKSIKQWCNIKITIMSFNALKN